MPLAFGGGGRPGDPRGIEIPVGPELPPDEQIADDIHAIRRRYVIPPVLDAQPFGTLAANAGKRYDFTNQRVNALMVTVTSGLLFIYFGDFTSGFGRAATTPHAVVSAGVVPVTQIIPIPPNDSYIVCVQEGAAAAGGVTGCLTPMAL